MTRTLSGLKARATLAQGQRPRSQPRNHRRAERPAPPLAWGNAPGHNRLTIGGLKARAKCLIRNFQ